MTEAKSGSALRSYIGGARASTKKKKKKKPVTVWSARSKKGWINKLREGGKKYVPRIPGIRQDTASGGYDEAREYPQRGMTVRSMQGEVHLDPSLTPFASKHRNPDGTLKKKKKKKPASKR